MTGSEEFHSRYVAELRAYLEAGDEARLEAAHELGRRALQERVSVLEIVENHFAFVADVAKTADIDAADALEFLLQTLAAIDVATRGFLDGTRRYEQQRARADDLADRDEFRTALVNSLQEGFFVADHDGAIVEINKAFAEITGYSPDGLPYRRPYPWTVSDAISRDRLRDGPFESEVPIRHRDGHITWVAVAVNTVRGADRAAYVGTIRDINATRAASVREGAVMRLATAVSVATTVAEVLSITLDECRSAIEVHRVIGALWPADGSEPTVHVAGEPAELSWRELDPDVQRVLEDARHRLPLTVQAVGSADDTGRSIGIVATLSGARDVALWLEHSAPRRFSAEDRMLVTALVGHLSLAVQHVRQFESARETSLTLQRAMLPAVDPPAGFAVRYEPAVSPLEIGGDWHDVLPVDDHSIGVIVGDCVGRGLPAAAVMGQLRSSARALLLTGAQPATLLEQLDSAAALIPGAFCTTVFVAIIDTESGVLRYSNAGHPPAVLAVPQAEVAYLTEARSVPLAVHHDDPRPQWSQRVPAGSTLIFYTDGLVERRNEPIDTGIARVAEVLARTVGLSADAVAEKMLGELAPRNGYDDDVAIVVCQTSQCPLRIENDATADRLNGVRQRLAEWLRASAVPEDRICDIVLGVNEACTNTAEHAYAGRQPGTMRLEAHIDGSDVRVRVVDSGSWKTPPADPGFRGRGLPLIRAVADRVALNATPAGTTVEMDFRVPSAG